jgi:hypothetical protein
VRHATRINRDQQRRAGVRLSVGAGGAMLKEITYVSRHRTALARQLREMQRQVVEVRQLEQQLAALEAHVEATAAPVTLPVARGLSDCSGSNGARAAPFRCRHCSARLPVAVYLTTQAFIKQPPMPTFRTAYPIDGPTAVGKSIYARKLASDKGAIRIASDNG